MVWSNGWSATMLTGFPAIVSASTRELPEDVDVPLVQETTWLAVTTPVEIADVPRTSCDDLTLAVAARTPFPRRVCALGSETVIGPTGAASAGARASVLHGEPSGLATAGSEVTVGGVPERAALARQLSACACAGAALSAPANAATPSIATV